MTLRSRLLALIVSAAALLGGVVGLAATPAMAVGHQCFVSSICFYDTPVSADFFHNRDAADAPRNVPFSVGSRATDYIQNTTNYVWIVSTSTNCANQRGTIHSHSSGTMAAPWAQGTPGIICYYRTSTVGGKVAGPDQYPSVYAS